MKKILSIILSLLLVFSAIPFTMMSASAEGEVVAYQTIIDMSDYDGVTFRSQWQDYRENTENDSDPLHCIYTAVLRVPRKAGRTVCVKAVDVFGFESMVVETIG